MTSVLFGLLVAQVSPVQEFHVAGEGFFRFTREGRTVFSRDAGLVVRKGQLVHSSGLPLLPSVEGIGAGERITIDAKGVIFAASSGQTPRQVGRIVLAVFPTDLRPIQSGSFWIAADRPGSAFPTEKGAGSIMEGPRQGVQPAPKPAPAAAVPPIRIASSGLQITLKTNPEVESEKILLGDIADITGPANLVEKAKNIDFGPTPPIGVNRPLDRSLLQSRIARAGIDLASSKIIGSEKFTVARVSQKVTHDQFVKTAIEAIRKELPGEIGLEASEPGPIMPVPIGTLSFSTENVSVVKDKASVQVNVFVDGVRFNGRIVHLSVNSPLNSLKVGQPTTVRVKSGGATIQTVGKIRRIDLSRFEVSVETPTGALLIGKLAKDGAIEVTL